MKATRLRIHNFRSVKDLDVELTPYGLLVGPNNAGKSNVLAAVRAFYEDGQYSHDRDFPKFPTNDDESWVELTFHPEPDDFEALKDDYKGCDGTFTVRRYFESQEKDDEGKERSGLYSYASERVSGSRFYGAKNIQQARLGKVIYIPAVTKLDDQTKMSGPSPLRDLINNVLKSVLETSPVYENFRAAFESFRAGVKTEISADGSSLTAVESDITNSLAAWGTTFRLDIRNIDPDAILRSLIEPSVVDPASGAMPPDHFGHGLQRHLVYSLLLRASRPSKPPAVDGKRSQRQSKDFAPEFTWLLFEEPEAFLHPTQTDALDRGLRAYAASPANQVLITTHSTRFSSRNMTDLSSLVRLDRVSGVTSAGQLRRARLQEVLATNQVIAAEMRSATEVVGPGDEQLEMESIKYALWLDPSRAAAFFAARVFLVEGPTERVVFQYLVEQGRLTVPEGGLVFLDTFGKWNTHRFIGLLSGLRIPHVVLHDLDKGGKPAATETAMMCANMIEEARTEFTRAIDTFDANFEAFLGLAAPHRPANKPQNAMWHLQTDRVDSAKIHALCAKVQNLLDALG